MKTTYGLPAKREEVIDVLNTAFAEQNLEEYEYENRVKEALNAKCIEELEVIVFDFPKAIKNKLFPKESAPSSLRKQNTDFPPAAFSTKATTHQSSIPTTRQYFGQPLRATFAAEKQLIPILDENPVSFQAIFGTQKVDFRSCRFEGTHFRLDVESIFSETTIDLRNQDLHGKHIDIFIKGALNEIKIYIPRGGFVQKNTQLILGDYSLRDKKKGFLGQINKFLGNDTPESNDISFTVTLHGNIFLGNIKVVY
ncbi:LiaF domain-containing protein [Bernardetia sp.]|uniref:LiaF domain-containing protein n=1 Tax=Bernardetia sp. TaxID=1937974 RepID=UPI0025C72463|nr:LiaF domain-containing protein [Bernardetia sp.]